jgi:chromosomal replication initiation ATPase DnaA
MISPPRQLALDWPHASSYAREDFVPASSNRDSLRSIDLWPNWAGRMLVLVGPEGSGKSHLGSIWAGVAGAVTLHAETLSDRSFAACAEASALLIEDVDRVGKAETHLFHLVNAALQNGVWLLMTARAAPDAWGLAIPDLLSRLRLAPVTRLAPPDMELTEAVLFKLFSDRQLQVEPKVVAYIAMRLERSLSAARAIVAALDREALARGRSVTRAVASEFLPDIPPSGDTT